MDLGYSLTDFWGPGNHLGAWILAKHVHKALVGDVIGLRWLQVPVAHTPFRCHLRLRHLLPAVLGAAVCSQKVQEQQEFPLSCCWPEPTLHPQISLQTSSGGKAGLSPIQPCKAILVGRSCLAPLGTHREIPEKASINL